MNTGPSLLGVVDMRRAFIKFGNLSSLGGKKIVKAYLEIVGMPRNSNCLDDPKEIFVHRLLESYDNLVKWELQPKYNVQPEASIIVGETNLMTFSIDITLLVNGWVIGDFPNYGLVFKENEKNGTEGVKKFYSSSKLPQLRVISLANN